jgi:hypothetical protein
MTAAPNQVRMASLLGLLMACMASPCGNAEHQCTAYCCKRSCMALVDAGVSLIGNTMCQSICRQLPGLLR